MKYSFIIVEGHHDIEFLARILKVSYSLKHIKQLDDLDPYWENLVPRNFPIEGDLAKRVPVPTFFQNDELSVALHSAGGDGNLAEEVQENLTELSRQSSGVFGIGIILDADKRETPIKRFELCINQFTELESPLPIKLSLPSSPGEVIKDFPRCGIFVLPDNKSSGTLEDILIECAERNYADLLNQSRNYIDSINISLLNKEDRKKIKKPAGKNKAIISSITSILRPTRSLAVSLHDNRWIDEETLKLDRLVLIRDFVGEIIGAL